VKLPLEIATQVAAGFAAVHEISSGASLAGGISSLLDAPVSECGERVGVLRHEHVAFTSIRDENLNILVAQRPLTKGVPSASGDTAVTGASENSRSGSAGDKPS
jgi:hypothetical protein